MAAYVVTITIRTESVYASVTLTLKIVAHAKYLGVVMDSNLNFSTNIYEIICKAIIEEFILFLSPIK